MNHLIQVVLNAKTAGFTAGMDLAGKGLIGLGSRLLGITGIVQKFDNVLRTVARAAVAVGAGLAAALAVAVKGAADFETAMRNVNTITRNSDAEFKKMSDTLLTMSTKLPQSATNLAEGMYDVASSGFVGAEGVQVLDAAAKGATAGLTSTAVAAKGVGGMLNAYGLDASHAADVSDILFQTVNLGVLTFEEMSSGLGAWAAMASAAGVSMEEATAALSAMTLAGIPAAEAHTSLARTIQAFIKPSEAMTGVVEQLGFTSAAAMLKELGLKASIEAVTASAGDSPEALNEVFKEVNALQGVLALGAANGANYARTFDSMTDGAQTAGAASRAYKEQAKTLESQLKLLGNSAQKFRIEIGTALLPVVKVGTGIIQTFATGLHSLPGPMKTGIALSSGFSTAILGLAGVLLIAKVRGMLVSGAIGLINTQLGTSIPRMTGAASGMNLLVTKLVLANPAAQKFATTLKLVGLGLSLLPAAAIGAFAGFSMAQTIISNVQQNVAGLKQEMESGWDTTSISGIEEAMDSTLVKINEANNLADEENWMDRLGQSLNPFDTNKGMQAQEEQKQYTESLAELARMQVNYKQNVADTTRVMGLSERQTLDLAEANGVDLTKNTEASSRSLEKLGEAGINVTGSISEGTAQILLAAHAAQISTDKYSALGNQLFMLEGGLSAAEAEAFALTETQKMLHSSLQSIGSPLDAFATALEDKKAVVQAFGQAQVDAGAITEGAFAKMTAGVKLNLIEYVTALESQNERVANWKENLVSIATAVGETNRDVVDQFAGMGEGSMDLVQQMADAIALGDDATVMRMVAAIKTSMREAGEQGAVELDAGLSVATLSGRKGAKQTHEAISAELGIGLGNVQVLAYKYAGAIARGINPILESLGKPPIPIPTIARNQYSSPIGPPAPKAPRPGQRGFIGPVQRRRALGGIDPHIANAETVLFGERETGGEAFIPMGRSKRRRSEDLLSKVAKMFGGAYVKMAEGGFNSVGEVPQVPEMGYNKWGNAAEAKSRQAREKTVAFLAAHLAAEAAKASAAAGSNFGGPPPANLSAIQGMVQGMAASRGWTGGEWNALYTLIGNESGWNPNAQNPTSTAYGLFQFLNSTWAAYGRKTSDPRGQAAAGLSYIAGRYGSPSKALGFWNSNSPHWYDSGGYLPTGMSVAINNTGKPERVLPANSNMAGRGGESVVFKSEVVIAAPVYGVDDLTTKIHTALDRRDKDLRRSMRRSN